MRIAFDVQNKKVLIKGKPDLNKLRDYVPIKEGFSLEPVGKSIYVVRTKDDNSKEYNRNCKFYDV